MDKTLMKGLMLIEGLAASDQPRGVTNLARELNMTKSNIHRLLNTLASRGYVRRLPEGGTYELTTKVWELGIMVRSRLSLVQVSHRHMVDLSDTTGELVHLSILDGFEVVYVDRIESQQPIASYTRIGGRAPAWCVATGKAILAHRPQKFDQLKRHLKPFSPASITDLTTLEQELADVRTQGYAINRGEWREDVFGIAAAIHDASGQVLGAVGISGPRIRFKPKKIKIWAAIVVDAARAISGNLGYDPTSRRFPSLNHRR
jgi:IclR family KDG regulon transcriptional repressor